MVCSWMHGNIQNNILRLKQCLMYKSFYRGNRRPSDMEYMDSPFLPMSICKAHWLVISMPWFLAGCMIIFRIIVSIHDLAVSNWNLGFRRALSPAELEDWHRLAATFPTLSETSDTVVWPHCEL